MLRERLPEVANGHVAASTRGALRAAFKPRNLAIFPTTTLVEVEDTHNRAGGVMVPQAEVMEICQVALELGLATFLDGARCGTPAPPMDC
jgi:threonine aldolase